MGMSDCPKCWDTPCTCGWEYKSWTKERREYLAAIILGVAVEDLRTAITAPETHPLLQDKKRSS